MDLASPAVSGTSVYANGLNTFKATCFSSTEPSSDLLKNGSSINIYSAFWGHWPQNALKMLIEYLFFRRPVDGSVELKHVALNIF